MITEPARTGHHHFCRASVSRRDINPISPSSAEGTAAVPLESTLEDAEGGGKSRRPSFTRLQTRLERPLADELALLVQRAEDDAVLATTVVWILARADRTVTGFVEWDALFARESGNGANIRSRAAIDAAAKLAVLLAVWTGISNRDPCEFAELITITHPDRADYVSTRAAVNPLPATIGDHPAPIKASGGVATPGAAAVAAGLQFRTADSAAADPRRDAALLAGRAAGRRAGAIPVAVQSAPRGNPRSAKDRLVEIRRGVDSGPGQIGIDQASELEIGGSQVGSHERRSLQAGRLEADPAPVARPGGGGEDGIAAVDPRHVGPLRVDSREVEPDVEALLPIGVLGRQVAGALPAAAGCNRLIARPSRSALAPLALAPLGLSAFSTGSAEEAGAQDGAERQPARSLPAEQSRERIESVTVHTSTPFLAPIHLTLRLAGRAR